MSQGTFGNGSQGPVEMEADLETTMAAELETTVDAQS